MKKNWATIGMAFYLLEVSNCYACSDAVAVNQKESFTKIEKRHTTNIMRAEGVLAYFPADVQSKQAWYGHNFMVGDVSVKPTPAFPSEKLLAYVGKRVTVSGTWNAGTTVNSSEIDQKSPMPIEQGQHNTVVRNDGIMVEKLEVLTDK